MMFLFNVVVVTMAEDLVLAAVQKARYNEIVHIEVTRNDEEEGGEDGTDFISSSTRRQEEICLIACLDEQHGGIQWNPLLYPDSTSSSLQETRIRRHLQTKQWVLPMLNDHRRNHLYQKAIEKAVGQLMLLRNKQKADCDASRTTTVLDIGSGTGLLSMMTARAFQQHMDSNKVCIRSVEMASSMAEVARRTIRDNDLHESITVSTVHSSQLDDGNGGDETRTSTIQQRADLCVSELLESGLLGEGLLPSLRDAWDRLLKPDALVIPQRARVYAAVVQGEWVSRYHPASLQLFAHDDDGEDDDDASAASFNNAVRNALLHLDELTTTTTTTNHDDDDACVVVPIHAHKLLQEGDNDKSSKGLCMLTEPVCVLTIDLRSRDRLPDELLGQRQTLLNVPVCCPCDREESGRGMTPHAVLVWWDLGLWLDEQQQQGGDSNNITYSMRPGAEPFQDHWHPCLHILAPPPCVRSHPPRRSLVPGDCVSLRASHDDSRIQIQLLLPAKAENEEEKVTKKKKRPRVDFSQQQSTAISLFSPERVFQLNDVERQRFFQRAISHALSLLSSSHTGSSDEALITTASTTSVLDLSDFSLCGFYAARAGCRHVISVESSTSSVGKTNLAQMSARIAQSLGTLVDYSCQFEILACHAEQLTLDILGGVAPEVVVAEPYYQVLEGWPLQEALNFYYLVRCLRSSSVITPNSVVIPSVGRIMACAIESEQLRSAYRPCGAEEDGEGKSPSSSRVCGFDHSALHSLCGFGDYTLSLPLWQYDYRQLTNDFELGRLNYNKPSADEGGMRMPAKTVLRKKGQVDALVVWLEYGYSYEDGCGGGEKKDDGAPVPPPLTISTNSRSYRQGVRMLKVPVKVLSDDDVARTEVHVELVLGGIENTLEDHQIVVHVVQSIIL